MGAGVSCNFQNIEYKACGILTSTVWSLVAGHVVLAIHRVHSLETNRAGQIPKQILVLSGLICSMRLRYFLINLTIFILIHSFN